MSASDWARGYPVNETYPPSWHPFQSPAHLRAACAVAGVAWDVVPGQPLHICELGCGSGYTSLMLAAGTPGAQVVGLDYNPAHIADARALAAEAGIDNARFIEADLAEMSEAELRALPEFDLVTVHGMWSWVGDSVREGVLRLIRQRLKAGGLVMMGYNALPGAAGALGLAKLMRGVMLKAGNSTGGVAAGSALVQRLVAAQPSHLPDSAWRQLLTGEVQGARAGYMLHEFQTEFWRPAFQSEVAAALGTARCEYLGSATLDENFPSLSLSPAQQALLDEAGDGASRELLFDLFVPRAFRRDLYVRGLRRVPRDPAIDALTLICARHGSGNVKLSTQAGDAELPAALVAAAREALAQGPQTVAQLRALPACSAATPGELLVVLLGSGVALPLWDLWDAAPQGDDGRAALLTCRRLNAAAARPYAPHGIGEGHYGLASPALAGGLAAAPMELAVAHVVAGMTSEVSGPEDAPAVVRRLVPPGADLPAAVQSELTRVVSTLLAERLPVWRSLAIV